MSEGYKRADQGTPGWISTRGDASGARPRPRPPAPQHHQQRKSNKMNLVTLATPSCSTRQGRIQAPPSALRGRSFLIDTDPGLHEKGQAAYPPLHHRRSGGAGRRPASKLRRSGVEVQRPKSSRLAVAIPPSSVYGHGAAGVSNLLPRRTLKARSRQPNRSARNNYRRRRPRGPHRNGKPLYGEDIRDTHPCRRKPSRCRPSVSIRAVTWARKSWSESAHKAGSTKGWKDGARI